MDEPTATLTAHEIDRLFRIESVASVRAVFAVVYVSHRLDEVKTICDRAHHSARRRVCRYCHRRIDRIDAMIRLMVGR
jgi:ABC-type sugar transport system ATPase subunit